MDLYKRYDMDEETPVQYVGVYTLKWRPEWGEPSVMFAEANETEIIRLFIELYSNPSRLQELAIEAGKDAPDWVRMIANANPKFIREALELASATMKQDGGK